LAFEFSGPDTDSLTDGLKGQLDWYTAGHALAHRADFVMRTAPTTGYDAVRGFVTAMVHIAAFAGIEYGLKIAVSVACDDQTNVATGPGVIDEEAYLTWCN